MLASWQGQQETNLPLPALSRTASATRGMPFPGYLTHGPIDVGYKGLAISSQRAILAAELPMGRAEAFAGPTIELSFSLAQSCFHLVGLIPRLPQQPSYESAAAHGHSCLVPALPGGAGLASSMRQHTVVLNTDLLDN